MYDVPYPPWLVMFLGKAFIRSWMTLFPQIHFTSLNTLYFPG